MLGTIVFNLFGVPQTLFAHSVVTEMFVKKKMRRLLGGKEKYENLKKIDWYFERYDLWPPIINEKILDRKQY